MSSLAQEFYRDGKKKSCPTPYDLDSYKTGVGLKSKQSGYVGNDWRTLCESTSPCTIPSLSCHSCHPYHPYYTCNPYSTCQGYRTHNHFRPSYYEKPVCCNGCE